MKTFSLIFTSRFRKQFNFSAQCKYLAKLVASPFLLAALYMLKVLVNLRVGTLLSARIGHLAVNTEYWLRTEHLRNRHKGASLILSSAKPSNRQLLEMIRRRMTIPLKESDLLYKLMIFAQYQWPEMPFWLDLTKTGTFDYELWSNSSPQLSFTEEEMKKGAELLRSLGIPEGAPFVCFAIRDKAYLEVSYSKGGPNVWRYHDYRDADIENCCLMAEWLASQDIWVIRMGAVVEKPFRSSSPKVIDYASTRRSDFGDIFLSGNCKFFVGDTAGIFWVSGILGIPVALTNLVPITHLFPVPGSMVMPKKYRWKNSERLIPYGEVVARGLDGFVQSSQYDEAGVDLLENTPEEILGMAVEINSRIDGTWESRPEDESLHDRFWSIFPVGHRAYGCPARVSIDFLRRNEDLLP